MKLDYEVQNDNDNNRHTFTHDPNKLDLRTAQPPSPEPLVCGGKGEGYLIEWYHFYIECNIIFIFFFFKFLEDGGAAFGSFGRVMLFRWEGEQNSMCRFLVVFLFVYRQPPDLYSL